MSDYIIHNGTLMSEELYHYGVKGMKWGHRKAYKFQRKANIANESAREWDEMAKRALSKGKAKRAEKYSKNAAQDRADAETYQNRANARVEKKYTKAGKTAGRGDYWAEKGNKAYEKHESAAKLLDKAAKKYDKNEQLFKAEAARRSAEALRARGENVRAANMKTAERYVKKSTKLNTKASDFATRARVDIGKKRVDEVVNAAKKKGYASEKKWDDRAKEANLRDRLGDDGYDVYKKVRGK